MMMKESLKRTVAAVLAAALVGTCVPVGAEGPATTTDLTGETAPEDITARGYEAADEFSLDEEAGKEEAGEEEEQAEETAAPLFSSGYALLSRGTTVYADEQLTEALGVTDDAAVVYVSGRRTVDGADRDVLTVRFCADGESYTGYLRAGKAEEAEQAAAEEALKTSGGMWNGIALTEIAFTPAEAAAPEVTEAPAETAAPEATEAPAETAAPETAEATAVPATQTDLAQPTASAKPAATASPAATSASEATSTDLEPSGEDGLAARAAVTSPSVIQTGSKTVTITWYGNGTAYRVYEGGRSKGATFTHSGTAWTAVLTGVSIGKHVYTVVPVVGDRAVTANGTSCKAVNVVDVPPKPTLKAAQGTAAENTVALSWKIKSNKSVGTYTVYEVNADGTLTPVKTGITKKNTSFTLTGVSEGTHTYCLGAVCSGNASLESRSAQVTVTVSPLWSAAPQSVKAAQASSSDTTITVSWTKKYVNPASWLVEEDGDVLAECKGSAASCTILGEAAGTHILTVVPLDADGNRGTASAPVTVTVKVGWLTSAPTLTAVQSTDAENTVTLTVKTPKNCTAPTYSIYDLSVSADKPVASGMSGGKTSFTLTLKNQSLGEHTYVAAGTNASGQTGPSSARSTLNVVPLWCSGVTKLKASLASSTSGRVRVTWSNAYTAAPDYLVTAWLVVSGGKTLAGQWLSGGSTSLTTDVLENGTYLITVQPCGMADGKELYADAVSAKVKIAVTWKNAPSLSVSQAFTKAGTMKISVKAAATFKSARLQVSVDGGSWLNLVSGTTVPQGDLALSFTSGTALTVSGLAEGEQHTVRARYLSSGGECSKVNEKTLYITPAALFAPKNVTASQTEERDVTVSWTPFAADDDTQYLITAALGRVTVGTFTADASPYVCTVPSTGKYTFTVTPVRGTEKGSSGSASVKVKADYWKLAPVIGSVRQTDSDEVTLWFSAARAATDYVLYDNGTARTSGVEWYMNGSSSFVVVSGLSGTHSFMLAAEKRSGDGTTTLGSKSAKKTVRIGTVPELADVTNLTVAAVAVGSVTLTWSAPNATAFRFYDCDLLTGGVTEISSSSMTLSRGWMAMITGIADGSHIFGVQPVTVKPTGATACGRIVWSGEAAVSVPGTARRTNVAASQVNTSRSVSVTWTNPGGTDADSIHIYLDGTDVLTVAGTAQKATLTGVAVGIHTVAVTAVSDTAGEGPMSAAVQVNVFNPVSLLQPTGLGYLEDASTGNVTLQWKAGGKTYERFRVYLVTGAGRELVTEVSALKADLTGLALGTCTYVVVPVSCLGDDETLVKEGTASASITVTVSVYVSDSGLTYTANAKAGTATITAYTGTAESLYVPETIGSCTVTAIAAGVFEGSSLKYIRLPDTIDTIGKRAFANCKAFSGMN